MSDLEIVRRFKAVNDEAARLGYRIEVDLVTRRPERWRALAVVLTDESSERRFLSDSDTSSLDAAEAGLERLRELSRKR